ncbi:TPA: hypothetical protein IGZ57_002748 [Escherichia coli]|nr:hypothetical protein [Escherichia coli]HAO0304104.1 hypothetical protein [Escherichia coli]HAO0308328.1 hypothetical protein [Escherichia coli]HAX9913484.1 hypothetical protein [Escherichia coli]HAY0059838.1 hypothetical protein [Escherichia coli]
MDADEPDYICGSLHDPC